MEKIELYDIISDSPTATSSAVYWKAKKNNEYFFLKRFNDPSRPSDRVSPEEVERKNRLCDRFEKERNGINEIIRKLGGGNFVAPVDFFVHKRRYYQATPWRDIEKKTIGEIVCLSDKEKLLILKTATNSLRLLHEQGIIHCDIKPDNLPVTATKSNTLTCSLIDFDVSHFENDIPHPDEVYATDPYMSPELASYKMQKNYYGDYKFNVKNDVFAVAIVFHYYWSGENFLYNKPERGPYLYNAVLEDAEISVSSKIPQWLKELLLKMIDKQPEKRPSMSEVLECLKQVNVDEVSVAEKIDVPEKKADVPEKEQTHQEQRSDEKYIKGEKFPEDAVLFQVLPNGNVKIVYDDGAKIVLNVNVALKRQYIAENYGG